MNSEQDMANNKAILNKFTLHCVEFLDKFEPTELQALKKALQSFTGTQIEGTTRGLVPRSKNNNPCKPCSDQRLKCEIDPSGPICKRCKKTGKECIPKASSPSPSPSNLAPPPQGWLETAYPPVLPMYGPQLEIPAPPVDSRMQMNVNPVAVMPHEAYGHYEDEGDGQGSSQMWMD